MRNYCKFWVKTLWNSSTDPASQEGFGWFQNEEDAAAFSFGPLNSDEYTLVTPIWVPLSKDRLHLIVYLFNPVGDLNFGHDPASGRFTDDEILREIGYNSITERPKPRE